MPSQVTLSIQDLAPLAGTPHWPEIIDVRIDEDRQIMPFTLPCARWIAHRAASASAVMPGSDQLVVVCHKGLKLSQGVAAALRMRGQFALALEGGCVAWSEAGLPALSLDVLKGWTAGSLQPWVTATRPDLNALAAIWLLTRFVTATPEIWFVASDQVPAVAERFDATDLEPLGMHFTDLCTHFGLMTPALDRMAKRLSEIDGLINGLRALHHDDHALVTAAIPLLDGLHAAAGGTQND